MNTPLADRVSVLRDEVLETAEAEDGEPAGTEIFDAIVRALVVFGETDPGLDHTLHDAIAQRLAWGDTEDIVLGDVDRIGRRLLGAAQRALRDPLEDMLVAEVTTDVVCAAARIVALAAVGRAGRERAAALREELAQRRLQVALDRQEHEMKRLEKKRTQYDF